MIENLTEFNAGLDDFIGREVPDTVRTVVKVIGNQALRGFVLMTPVDTGRARGNWQVSVNVTIDDTIARTDRSGSAALAAGFGAIDQARPYSVIYLQNNLPYIERLEHGHSKQAPSGMVGVTLAGLAAQFA